MTTTPTSLAKLAALRNVVQGLLARGIPVDAVGHQMHVNIESPSIASIREAIETFAELGLDNQVTEMDVSLYTNSTDRMTVIPPELLVRQGYRYRDIFRELRRLGDRISSVTLWGIADDNTWLKTFPIARLDLPLLFDEDLQAKPAYWGVVDPTQLPVLIQELNVAQGTPRIDGRKDLVWATTGAQSIDAGEAVSASFKVLWDEHHLYLTADVSDATRSSQDKLEVFVDENNAKTTSYEDDDAQYVFERFGFGRHGHGRRHRCQPVRFHVLPRPGGYRVEAAIRLERELAVGDLVGFDVRVTDFDTGAVVSWNDFTLGQEADTSEFGTLRLVEENQIAGVAPGTPIIDGVVDPVWATASELTTGTWVLGSGGATAQVRTLWDEGHLYVLARVSDALLSKASANAWEQDSLEVFLDQNNGKTVNYEPDDGQFRVNFENTQSFGGSASGARIASATTLVPGGYLVEAAIAFDAIEARPGTLVGFDVQVNDDGLGDGVRSGVVTWNDPTGESYRNTSRFGVLRLGHRRQPWFDHHSRH